MIRGDRIKELLAQLSLSQAALARAINVSPQAISKMVVGGTVETGKLHQIARFLGTTPEYLTGESNVAKPAAAAKGRGAPPAAGADRKAERDELAHEMGLIEIEEIDLGIGMGAAYIDDAPVNSIARWMPEDWVRRFTAAPAAHLTIANPRGDSMYPTINDRDIIIIDKSRRSIDEQEAIWALFYGGLGTIKRVRAMPDGSYKLMADNPNVREETAYDGEMSVFGRVVGVIRRT